MQLIFLKIKVHLFGEYYALEDCIFTYTDNQNAAKKSIL